MTVLVGVAVGVANGSGEFVTVDVGVGVAIGVEVAAPTPGQKPAAKLYEPPLNVPTAGWPALPSIV
ncbi:MAG: hypothetical protein PVG71_12290 [Anaerolineae bacterium]